MNGPAPRRALGQSGRPADAFVGRRDELAVISSYVDAIVSGSPWVIWVEGDAGSGKTALVRQALSGLSSEVRVLQATADELSADVELAVVDQLGAIRGRSGFVAGLELLAHIGEAEDSGPVIVVVEDLHWADTASRQALLTLARRLDQDRVLMILTSRPGGAPDGWDRFRLDSARCASISVGPLSVAEVAALAQAVGVPLGPGGAERLHRHTNGHPLYARTLLAELDPAQLAAGGDLPVPRSLAMTIVATLTKLPTSARELASALAVLNQRVPLTLAGQVAGTTDTAMALEHLLPTGFVEWRPREQGTPVELTHPLFRMAIYDDLSPTFRRRYHLAAAALVDAPTALEHRAAAADGPDDDLAAALANAAEARQRSGALSSAAAYFLRASGLSANPRERAFYLLRGVELVLLDQQVSVAATFRAQVDACPDGAQLRMAYELLAPAGADPFLQGIEADLTATGTGPRRRRSYEGRSSVRLTDRQHEVAVPAARGLTNREIADHLYLSEKAVEYHLGHVFGKLGLRSRRELREHPAVIPGR